MIDFDKVADFIFNSRSGGVFEEVEGILKRHGYHLIEPMFSALPSTGEKLKLAYVDGGSSELLSLPNMFIYLHKVAAVVYEGRDYVKRYGPYYFISCLAPSVNGRMKTTIFGDLFFMDRCLEHVSGFWHILNAVPRRVAEKRLAKHVIKDECDGVVLDGTLGFQNERNEINALKELIEIVEEREAILAGLAKSTKITYKGIPLTKLVEGRAKEKGLRYFIALVGKVGEEPRRTTLFVIKLSSAAVKPFLLEVFSEKRLNDLIYNLALSSCDPSIPGYPYPLIEVDKIAKVHVRDEFKAVRSRLIEKILERGGEFLIKEALFHDLLNTINP